MRVYIVATCIAGIIAACATHADQTNTTPIELHAAEPDAVELVTRREDVKAILPTLKLAFDPVNSDFQTHLFAIRQPDAFGIREGSGRLNLKIVRDDKTLASVSAHLVELEYNEAIPVEKRLGESVRLYRVSAEAADDLIAFRNAAKRTKTEAPGPKQFRWNLVAKACFASDEPSPNSFTQTFFVKSQREEGFTQILEGRYNRQVESGYKDAWESCGRPD